MNIKLLRRRLVNLQSKKADICGQIRDTKAAILAIEQPTVTSLDDLNFHTQGIIEQILLNQKADIVRFYADRLAHIVDNKMPEFDEKLKKYLLTLPRNQLCIRGCGRKTWVMLSAYINSQTVP